MGNGVVTSRAPEKPGLSGGWLSRWSRSGRPHGLSDRELVERAADGDGSAFGALYERYVEDVHRYLLQRLRDPQQAEDLTQDVFVNALRALADFQWQGAFRPWLLRVAHHRLVNHWRTLGRRPQLADLPEDAAPEDDPSAGPELADELDLGALVALRLDSAAAEMAIARLTELQQQALALRFGLELSVAETAAVMGRSQSAVKNLQFSALGHLRTALRREDGSA